MHIFLLVISMIALLIVLSTFIPKIPVTGSVSSLVTISCAHLWLPLCAVGTVAAGACFFFLKVEKTAYGVSAILFAASLAGSILLIRRVEAELRKANVAPKLYAKEDVSRVKVESVSYTVSEYGEVRLNVYSVDDSTENKPIVFYIHGGGWIMGTREDHSYYSKYFASHGYLAVSVDYDLSDKDRHLAGSTEKQILEAFAWVRAHAAEYHGDLDRFFVTGDSAGGNLALELSYKINGSEYACAAGGQPLPHIQAVSVLYPVADPASFYRNPDLVLGSTSRKMAYSYTGCSPEEDKALYDSLTPKNFISKSTPPTSILVGTADAVVPPEETYLLADVLTAAEIKTRLVKVPLANHICDMPDGNMLCNAFLELTMNWFAQSVRPRP